MADIKTRDSVKDIKVLDKANVAGERMKKAFIRSKNTAENLMDDGQVSPSEYAEDKVRYAAEDVVSDTGHAIKRETDKAVDKGREALREHRREKKIERQERRADEALHRFSEETQQTQSVYQNTARMRRGAQARNTTIKTAEQTEKTIKQTAKSTGKATVKTAETSVKATEKTIKTAEATSKAAVKTAEATAKAAEKAAEAAAKTAQKMAEMARQAAIAAYKAAIAVGKAIAAAVKAIIAAVKELIAAIAAGGWLAVVVIVVICLIGLIVASCFGIFFSSEDKNDGSQTMREVVVEINQDYQNQLDSIKANNPYDTLEMSGSRAVWPEVLSVYAVKTTTDPDNPQEVASLNDEKKQLLTDIFWEMNDISYRTKTETETEIIESDDGHGNILEETVEVTKTTLYITVSHKTVDQMADQYRFNDDQDSQLEELLNVDNSMWLAVLYGVYGSDDMIVQVALSQIGNVGGEPYWSWYGFGSRVEWCACFVSWCADQCGYIETGICPKYAGCVNGVAWFKEHNQWIDGSETPSPGMIIFYDWDSPNGESGPQDGESDHTGIVEKVENGIVYTVEGNSGDACRQRQRAVGDYEILGYGVLIP
ncbi:MAG: CHAP domain-containing protein [Eubacteriales bacterium]|nr:CHAP domain-containing protein [Eubacteriales bacterium]